MGVQALKHAALLQEWSDRIRECRSSGTTVKAWCAAQSISLKTYYYWEKRLVEQTGKQTALSAPTRAGSLARVEPDTLRGSEILGARGCITIQCGNSIITLPDGSSADTIAELVRALNRYA